MTRMLALAGADDDVAASNAKTVLALETKLAAAQLDRVGRRDPKNRDNKMSADALTALVPSIDLKTYLASAEAPAFTRGQRRLADVLQGPQRHLGRDLARRSEDLRALAGAQRVGAAAGDEVRAGELRVLQHAVARHQGAAAAVEDVRRRRGRQPRRGARAALRREGVWRRQQGAHEGAGGRADRGPGAGHQSARLDDAGHQGQGAGEAAAAEQEQDRLPRHSGATTPRSPSRARTTWGTTAARIATTCGATTRSWASPWTGRDGA